MAVGEDPELPDPRTQLCTFSKRIPLRSAWQLGQVIEGFTNTNLFPPVVMWYNYRRQIS